MNNILSYPSCGFSCLQIEFCHCPPSLHRWKMYWTLESREEGKELEITKEMEWPKDFSWHKTAEYNLFEEHYQEFGIWCLQSCCDMRSFYIILKKWFIFYIETLKTSKLLIFNRKKNDELQNLSNRKRQQMASQIMINFSWNLCGFFAASVNHSVPENGSNMYAFLPSESTTLTIPWASWVDVDHDWMQMSQVRWFSKRFDLVK